MKKKTYKEKYEDCVWQKNELGKNLLRLEGKWDSLRMMIADLLKDEFEPKHSDEN